MESKTMWKSKKSETRTVSNFPPRVLSKYGVLDSRVKDTLAKLEDVPVDIR